MVLMQILSSKQRWFAAKAAIWVAVLIPAARLIFRGVRDELGANPIEEVIHQTGWWGILLLTITLAITPVRRLTGWHRIIRFRRVLGLFAFFYVSLHLAAYVVLDQWFAFEFILEDISERPFITVGFAAWLILLALAVTSTRGWIGRLRGNWRRLHRLVYLASGFAALHFFWNVKADTLEPLVFGSAISLLLAMRAPALRRTRSTPRPDRSTFQAREMRPPSRPSGSPRPINQAET
ncbi:MAG: sulfoxide reductase heme-binding subunit YedZ [Gemmatimonadales bacterium]|jgi:sulfoxide reductase heme-binding subunit YedZ